MAIGTVGIDLAKNVFAVHGVDETGKPALVRLGNRSSNVEVTCAARLYRAASSD